MVTPARFEYPTQLNRRYQRTYEAIMRNPPAQRLAWYDVRSMLESLADEWESDHDSFRAMLGGQEVVLHSPSYKDFATAEDVVTIRRFLTQTCESHAPARVRVAVGEHD